MLTANPKKFARRNSAILRATGYFAAYACWVLVFRLVVLTLITYFLVSSGGRYPGFGEISDVLGSNELILAGLSSLIFVLALCWLNPIASVSLTEIFSSKRFEKLFAPGFLHGAALALGVTLAFLLSGLYRYLGFYIQFEDVPLGLGNVFLRILGLGALVYFEEYIFRGKILGLLNRQIPAAWAAAITAAFYCAIKAIQFDLGLMHLLTLFLLSLSLAARNWADGDFVRGAGFWAGLLIVFHPLLSLPVLGDDFSGVLLIKYQAAPDAIAAIAEGDNGTFRFLTGGAGGPLSSFALQLVLLIYFVQSIFKNKNALWAKQPGS